jgi:signal transduction histidine kinase
MSQEIHDNIGQVLSLAKLNINTMSGASPELLEGKINDSKHLISKAIQDLRDLSRSLNTDYVIEMGLLRSVEYELELIKKTGTLETILRVEGKPYRLEQQQELILFRIVQEILHNIIKHAKATQIDVFVQYEPELFTLTVSDNGVGFDASKLAAADYSGFGLGIRNMHNRAKMINTNFTLKSTVEKGVTVLLQLPVRTL